MPLLEVYDRTFDEDVPLSEDDSTLPNETDEEWC